MVLKRYKVVIDGIYASFSGTDVPGKKPFVSLDSFRQICVGAMLLDDRFGERDVPVAYNLAMMTQVDEVNSTKILEMNYLEFLEGLARVAEQCNIYPLRIAEEEVH